MPHEKKVQVTESFARYHYCLDKAKKNVLLYATTTMSYRLRKEMDKKDRTIVIPLKEGQTITLIICNFSHEATSGDLYTFFYNSKYRQEVIFPMYYFNAREYYTTPPTKDLIINPSTIEIPIALWGYVASALKSKFAWVPRLPYYTPRKIIQDDCSFYLWK